MKAPKPSRRAAVNEWRAWQQRAHMAEHALRKSAKAAYEKRGLEIPSENPAPIGEQSSLPSTDSTYGLHRAGRVEVQE